MTTATNTKERPILFSGEMVRAILDGRKTQTRRIVKPQPPEDWFPIAPEVTGREKWGVYDDNWSVTCPYGGPGNLLWVRESWSAFKPQPERFGGKGVLSGATVRIVEREPVKGQCVIDYRADRENPTTTGFWRPSIHMPRWASRLTLEITGCRIERLKTLSAPDVAAEGYPFSSDLDQFKLLWDKLNGRGSWNANPWVWVIEFKRIT